MALELKEKWLWDSWYIQHNDIGHVIFLQANRSLGDPELRHWHASIGHAISTDLVNWEYLGTCFEPARGESWDNKTTWTGCIIDDDKGLFHLFYTGTSDKENGLYQRIGHAISKNLHDWKRVGNGFCLDLVGDNSDYYEVEHIKDKWHDRAMRDPWVIKNPNGSGWLMFFTARASGITEANAGGAIGLAKSEDLDHWQLQQPVFTGVFGQLEVPQVFEWNNHWYLMFCNTPKDWSKHYIAQYPGIPTTGTHYMLADSPLGPWQMAPGSFFDVDELHHRYAGHIIEHRGQHYLMGFENETEQGFSGRLLDPVPVRVEPNGMLKLYQKP
ncbi:MAG: glycoside hydrolase family 68 protein [Reinekea sp.]